MSNFLNLAEKLCNTRLQSQAQSWSQREDQDKMREKQNTDGSFFHHYQGSIDFNIVNIHPTAAMYLFVSTGNRNDIEWNDQQWS